MIFEVSSWCFIRPKLNSYWARIARIARTLSFRWNSSNGIPSGARWENFCTKFSQQTTGGNFHPWNLCVPPWRNLCHMQGIDPFLRARVLTFWARITRMSRTKQEAFNPCHLCVSLGGTSANNVLFFADREYSRWHLGQEY